MRHAPSSSTIPARRAKSARFNGASIPCCWRPLDRMMKKARSSGEAVLRAHRLLFLAVPVALLLRRALVVILLALGQADLDLYAVVLPVHRDRHQRVAFALDRTDQLVDLGAVQQQLARAPVVGDDMRRGGDQRRDRCTEQVQFAVPYERVAVAEVDAPGAQ